MQHTPVSPTTPMNPTPSRQNPYSFLFEEPKKSKKKLIPSGNSLKQRIILAFGILVILLIIGMLLMAVLGSSSKNSRLELTAIAKQQTELIRVANIGVSKARDPNVKNLALTTSVSLESSYNELLAAYKKNGIKFSKDDLAGSKNAATDTLLTNADQANNFDAVFSQELKTQLSAYKAALKKAYDSAKGNSTRTALAEAFSQASILTDSGAAK